MGQLFPFLTEQLVTKEQAEEITKPFWADLSKVWESSWREWHKLAEDQRGRLAGTSFVPPIMMFGFAQSYAKEIFSGRETEGIVVCTELPNVFGFYIDDTVLLRFNAVDNDFVVRNVQNGTDRKDQYYRQEPIRGLNNSATRLTVGHLPNAAKSELAMVVLSCQMGEDLYYSLRIDNGGDELVETASPAKPREPNNLSLRKASPR